MYNIKIDLMVCNDDLSLLKAPEQTEEDYKKDRQRAFCRLNDFINKSKKLIDLNLQGQDFKELAKAIKNDYFIDINID